MSFEDMEATLRGGGVKAVSAPQLFPTPAPRAARMVALAELEPGDTVLEPSAGTGAILNALPEDVNVTAVEINHSLAAQLQAYTITKGVSVKCADFLECTPDDLGTFDAVIANPPFTKGQDVDHIRHMWDFVKPGGRLVTLSSTSWTFNQQRKYAEFREWIDEIGATHEILEPDTFKSSGTGVRTTLITARKGEPVCEMCGDDLEPDVGLCPHCHADSPYFVQRRIES